MVKLTRFLPFIVLASSLAAVPEAHAVLVIEITGGMEHAQPIAIVPFGSASLSARADDIAVSAIVGDDLKRSGRFLPLEEQALVAKPSLDSQVDFRTWRTLGVEHLLVGRINIVGQETYEVGFRLYDVYSEKQVAGHIMRSTKKNLRRVAHQVADIVYEKITGEKGVFNTRIAYITEQRDKKGKSLYTLSVADSDGWNEQHMLRSRKPLMSPAWSPDGKRMAYVSFEQAHAEIYVQELASGAKTLLTSLPGINGAPRWSPKGDRLALTLSKDGNPEIYILDMGDRKLKRLTSHWSIDTEPTWSPDGEEIVFTSDRGGRPQLYKVPARGGSVSRVTFEGESNARGTFSSDGKYLAMEQGTGNTFRIAIMELDTGYVRVLTQNTLDESPSFSPDGRMIIFASQHKDRGVLSLVSVDGSISLRLGESQGDVREPVWSPYLN